MGNRMRDKTDRRHVRLYPIQLPLLHTPRGTRTQRGGIGWTRDLSEEGACVELAERLHSHMPLRLRLRTDHEALELEGAVTWTGQSSVSGGGILHGVTFTHLDADELQALQEVLLSKGLLRPAKARLPFEVAVTCHPKGHPRSFLHGATRDVSRGGMLLRLGRVVPPGTVLELTLHTPTWPIVVQGTIVWVAPPEGRTRANPIGHGLRFASLGWTTALALARLLIERI